MKICRFDDNRLGAVRGDLVHDVSGVLERLPTLKWPVPLGDLLISHLEELAPEIEHLAERSDCRRIPVNEVQLLSPVANPTKIMGAGANFEEHRIEVAHDEGIHLGRDVPSIKEAGLFSKMVSSLVGPSEGVQQRFVERRNDFETELALVIGKRCTKVSREAARNCIAGYAIGLDMSLRGTESPSVRKSLDSYSVLGPWLVTPDEIADPGNLDIKMSQNGHLRQNSNTRHMIFDVYTLVELASKFFTLYPGDIIMTGTPSGVSPVKPGDLLEAEIACIGRMQVHVIEA